MSDVTLVYRRTMSSEDVVHVQRVLERTKKFKEAASSPNDFKTDHSGYTNLKYLELDTVTLYCIDDKKAYFVETDLGESIYSSDKSPFLYQAQYSHAKNILDVSLESFLKFAEDLGDPSGEVILISNTGRCGSTLLVQMLEATGMVVALSEPDSLLAPLSSAQPSLEMLKATFRVLCKPVDSGKHVYAIKPRSQHIALMQIIGQNVPFVKHAFMYRNSLDTVISFMNAFHLTDDNFTNSLDWLSSAPAFTADLNPEARSMVNSPLTLMAWFWASHVKHFLSSAQTCHTIRYEDLLGNEGNVEFTRILAMLSLPEELCDQGMLAKQKDSQRGTFLSNENARLCDKSLYKDDQKVRCDGICDVLKVPRFDDADHRF